MARAADTSRQPAGEAGAVLDACVLVPFTLRGLLLDAAEQRAFRPVWSEPILTEVKGVLLGKGMIQEPQWDRLNRAMRGAFPGAMVPTAEVRRIEPLMTNDRKDRHVVAAAVASRSPVVVTNNLGDFRASDLEPLGVKAIHPDAYLVGLLETAPTVMSRALTGHVENMRGRGRWTEGQVLGHLKGLGSGHAMAPRFAARAEEAFGIRAVAPPSRDGPRADRSVSISRASPSQGLSRSRSGREPRSSEPRSI